MLWVGNANIPHDEMYIKHQGRTMLQTAEFHGFYDPPEKRKVRSSPQASTETECPTPLFECSVLGCVEAFKTFAQLELHLDVGKHTVSRLNQYDAIKIDWVLKVFLKANLNIFICIKSVEEIT